VKRPTTLKGPEPTGVGFVKVAGSATLDQMCVRNDELPVEDGSDELRVSVLQA